jgi:hypothetical protein
MQLLISRTSPTSTCKEAQNERTNSKSNQTPSAQREEQPGGQNEPTEQADSKGQSQQGDTGTAANPDDEQNDENATDGRKRCYRPNGGIRMSIHRQEQICVHILQVHEQPHFCRADPIDIRQRHYGGIQKMHANIEKGQYHPRIAPYQQPMQIAALEKYGITYQIVPP